MAADCRGRLRGAIGRQANALLTDLRHTEGMALDTALPQLFNALVHVDAAGTATRRWASREELGTEPPMPRLIEALIRGRLLVAEETNGQATITLAHEVLLAAWPELCAWLDRNRIQRQRLQRWLLSLNASDPSDRRRAAEALGEMGPVTPEVVPALITVLRDPDTNVRMNAAEALGQMGPAAAEAISALTNAVEDSCPNVTQAASAALERIRSTSPAASS